MTERLYLADPYLDRFRARVVAARDLDGRRALVLDRSAFYPEGGGQPGDRGTLGGAAVVDTQERSGEVLHVLEAPALEPGAEVEAAIDWGRRFDHMQQHHGQHLLSAAFERVHGAATRSFHLGEKACTIDLDCSISRLDAPALRAAEAAANESVWRDLPVVARDFEGEERARLVLRKEAVKGNRVVLVEGVDASPCGGTHPRRTGEVGAIAVLRAQRWGEGMARIEFVCGGR
ncbi:MAG TPA: alanyl-tRNA editing protein, partial [Myxococcales bacterium]|nr:alanyl-tRNA editing protein [Myxococcales bacterium]